MTTALTFYLSAFSIGFLGSFHCAGMCGPIAIMLPKNSSTHFGIISGRLIYNSGRVVTYVIIGLFFGILGLMAAMKGLQRELSVITGIVILITVLLTSETKSRLRNYGVSSGYSSFIRNKLKKLFSIKSGLSLFLIGILNGLLPCGFVYLAIAGAATAGSAGGGMIYMALFGLGTFPIMMMISVAANYIGVRFKKIFSKVTTLIAIALAILLIFRGTQMKTESSVDIKNNTHTPVYCPIPIHVI